MGHAAKFLIAFLLLCTNAHANTRDGLVGWWKFDESSGNAADSSGRGNTGTPTDTTIVTNCPRSGCRSFNGTSDLVSLGNIFDAPTVYTFSAWIYAKSLGGGSAARILDKSNGGATGYYFKILSVSNLAVFHVGAAGDQVSTGTITLNAWQYVAVTWSGTQLIFYINAVSAGTIAFATAAGSDATA